MTHAHPWDASLDFAPDSGGRTRRMATATDLHPRLDPTHLAVVRCPDGWQPPALPPSTFAAIVASEDETTVVVPEALLDDDGWSREATQVDAGWRRITFAGPLPWELVGFLADVAGRLAGAQIPFTSRGAISEETDQLPGKRTRERDAPPA